MKKGMKLSWLLRHGANESKLAMDTGGFASIADVLQLVKMTRDELDREVADNNKSRFELKGDLIRACQGHSLDGTPVTQAGLEATWERIVDDALIYHGTLVPAARSIMSQGIIRGDRTHVHLAESIDAKAGKRHHVDVLLTVAPAKMRSSFGLFRAPNGVILAREVPRHAIVDVIALNAAGQQALEELRSKLVK